MEDPEQTFLVIHKLALQDKNILGLFLSGSRGKGFENQFSDYDIRLVFSDSVDIQKASEPYRGYSQKQVIEFAFFTLEQLRGYAEFASESSWDRYSFSHVKALIDKTGEIQALIDEKGRLPSQEKLGFIRDHLDGFINATMRSLKCFRINASLGQKLEAVSGISSFTHIIFALEGRQAPFLSYLTRELRAYPLESFPLEPNRLLQLLSDITDTGSIAAQQELMRVIEGLCSREGMADVFEAWEEDYPWFLNYKT